MRFSGVATAVLCLVCRSSAFAAPAVRAQATYTPPNIYQVQALLQSFEEKDVAWGAFYAGQFKLRSTIPLLLDRLASVATNASSPAELAILDALIQLDASVPAETLRLSFDSLPVQVLILLAHASEGRDDMLLSLLETTTGDRWAAAANLLLATRSPGLARQLLSDLQLKLMVTVIDESGPVSGTGLGGGTTSCGAAVILFADGFPPLADYQFSDERPGATLLALGPHPVYYVRTPGGSTNHYSPQHYERSQPSAFERIRYINSFFDVRSGPLYETSFTTVVWKSADDLVRHVEAERLRLGAQYRSVVSALLSIGYLTPADASVLRPNIAIAVQDTREHSSTSLPHIR